MKKIKLSATQEKLYKVLKFLVIFNLLAIPLHIILYFDINLYPLASLEQKQASFILNLFGVSHTLQEVTYLHGNLPAISVKNKVLAIGEPCTAMRSILAFIALVFASPRKLKDKGKAMIYIPVIYAANIGRIVTLAFVSLTYPSLFEFIHIFLWREGLVALIILLWVYWFNHSSR